MMLCMNIRTDAVWSIGQDDEIFRRTNSGIIVDSGYAFAHLDDIGGIIPISEGLSARDFAVFLTFSGKKEGETVDADPPLTEGYLVSAVDSSDGSGVLVHGDTLEESTKQFMSPELLEKLTYLDTIGVDLHGDFSLEALANYVKRKRRSTPA